MTTACSSTSIRRRVVSSAGKVDPVRVLEFLTDMSPTPVVTVSTGVPLRCVVPSTDRSCGVAPLTDVTSASMTFLQDRCPHSTHQLAAVNGL